MLAPHYFIFQRGCFQALNRLWTQSFSLSYIWLPGLLVVLVAEGVSVLDQPSIHRGKGYPVCQNCGKRMRLVQRGPRFDDSGYYERQIFACCYCDHHIERSVKTDGVARGLAHDVIE